YHQSAVGHLSPFIHECRTYYLNSRSTLVNSFAIFQLPMLESAFLPMGHNMSSTQTLMPQTKWTKNHF
ncbi:hypothetical protein ACLHZT_21730, partial [Aeromonas veronii]|uniref:hypothetical protein n=1 Tax=Aeromonas veronii TaxID=654 RepID=UPI003D069CB5